MAFNPFSPGTGVEHSELIEEIIANSAVIAVGEAVKIGTTGFITNATAGVAILGIAIGFKNADGSVIQPTAYSAGTATGTDVTSVTAAADNSTVAMKRVIIETSMQKQWSAQVNGTVGTTSASGKIGARLDIDSAGSNYARVLESTATRTDSTIANFYVAKTDPNDSTRLIVQLAASQKHPKQG